jgi:DNA polymerase elongation subunit (family B)
MKVVYGHTDSIYVQIDSVETAQLAIKEIEASVREHFPNVMGLEQHPVVLEFEKYYSALGVGTTKNRNAGMITWDDGEWLDKPKFTMTGFTAKRVSETPFAKEIQTNALKKWVNQESLEKINASLFAIYTTALQKDIPISALVKRSRLKSERFTVKCNECNSKYGLYECLDIKWCSKCGTETSEFVTLQGKRPSVGSGIAGVLYAHQKLNMAFDDSYLFIKVKHNDTFINPLTKEEKPVEYVAGITLEDFKDYEPDWEHYAQQVLKKAEPIYRAMNWDLSSIRTGKIQKKLDEWF